MPVESDIELSSGRLYFKDLDESIEIQGGSLTGSVTEATDDIEWADEQEPVIKFSTEPVEFTVDNVEFARDWTIVKCMDCGYGFPVTEMYALLYGTNAWRCPRCALNKMREEALSRQEHFE